MAILVLQPHAGAGIENYIVNSVPTVNNGISTVMQVGRSGAANRRGLIKFDLSSLPADVTIISATLSIYCILQSSGTDYDVAVHRSLVQWYEGAQNNATPSAGQDGSTWNLRNHNGSVVWVGGAGGASGSDWFATATDTVSITEINMFFDFDVTTDVADFVDGTFTNNGWWLLGNEAIDGSHKQFYTSDGVTTANHPTLTIEYTDPTTDMTGSAAGTSTVTGTIKADGRLAGAIVGEATTNALLGSNKIFGVVAGTSTVTGTIGATATIDGVIAGTSAVTGTLDGIAEMVGSASGESAASASGSFEGQLRGTSSGVASASATGWAAARHVARALGCFEEALLYITDGSIKENGQLNRLDLINSKGGFLLNTWRPVIAQYKNGGEFNDSPNYTGRRLTKRVFGNVIEVFELKVTSHTQNSLIQYTEEYFGWQESAADYWTSDWATLPIYLVAKAARETNPRYAIIHMMSIPELENPYAQPFYTASGRATFEQVTLRLERGDWTDTPPGQPTCVAISSIRSWTVAAWQAGS